MTSLHYELRKYAEESNIIEAVFIRKGKVLEEFIVVLKVDDPEKILDCNEFCFSMMEKYETLKNFYVYTAEEVSRVYVSLAEFELFYGRAIIRGDYYAWQGLD